MIADGRPALTKEEFIVRLSAADVPPSVAGFLWDEVQCYYFKPLQPDPQDRLIGEFRVDGDDLNDIAVAFEQRFRRKFRGEWQGPADPTLTEFAQSLLSSTEAK
jgi:hypothetical protein